MRVAHAVFCRLRNNIILAYRKAHVNLVGTKTLSFVNVMYGVTCRKVDLPHPVRAV